MVTAIAESEQTKFSHKADCNPRSGRHALEHTPARLGHEETDDEAEDGDNAENEKHSGKFHMAASSSSGTGAANLSRMRGQFGRSSSAMLLKPKC